MARRPTQERSRFTVEAILTAAEQVLRRGERATIRAIARRAGVGVGSIYDYFRDRDVLLQALVDRLTRHNDERLGEAWEGRAEQVPEAIDAIMDAVVEVYLESPALTRTAVRTIIGAGLAPSIVSARDAFVRRICDSLEPHAKVDPPELRLRALALADMLFGIILGELHRPYDAERRAALVEVARRAIRQEVESCF